MKLTRRYRFSASHRLHSPQLDEQRNQDLYGKCNNPYGHGHNYVLEVAIQGPVDAKTGQIMTRQQLDEFVEAEIVRVFDHKNMNRDIPEFQELVPTTENLARDLERRLLQGWGRAFQNHPARLNEIRIYETPRNIIELHSYENSERCS